PASCREAHTAETYVPSGTPGKRSVLRQVVPPSSEICTRPSSVPTHSKPSCSGDSASAEATLRSVVNRLRVTASGPHSLLITGTLLRSSCRVRSGLTVFQVSPRSSLRKRTLPARYSRLAECGLMMNGVSQFQRTVPLPALGRMLLPDFGRC